MFFASEIVELVFLQNDVTGDILAEIAVLDDVIVMFPVNLFFWLVGVPDDEEVALVVILSDGLPPMSLEQTVGGFAVLRRNAEETPAESWFLNAKYFKFHKLITPETS